MNLPKTTFLILTISIIQILFNPKLTLAQSQFLHQWCGTTTYTPNSTYQSNLNTILHLISTNTQITNGFYNFSVGHCPDRVSSLALCWGDVPPTTCRSCLQDASNWLLLPNVCPNQKEAFGYRGYCSIFITNETISNQVQDQTPPWYVTNTGNVADNDLNDFNTTLYALMGELRNRAASGNSDLKYADGNMSLKGGQKIYGFVQCTPDLDKNNCMDCIDSNILDYLPICCVSRTIKASEVKFVHPSCFARYALQPFFGNGNVSNMTPPAPRSVTGLIGSANGVFPAYRNHDHQTLGRNRRRQIIPTKEDAAKKSLGLSTITTVSKTRKRRNIKAISISILIGVSAILVIIFVFSILLRRKKLMGTKPRTMVKFSKEEMKALQSLQFSLGTIKYATRNFCDDNKIGEGGFGMVYKGKLSDGQEIAVKRLLRNKGQGDAEFKNEILILAGLRHRNLVRLEGFCLHRKEMILIYELVPNKSLDNFIFDPLKRSCMLWETRYKIINGIARGILYLHETSRLNIIHRDLKAANVLLDQDFNPKIADFGMARLYDIDQTQAILASKIVGTLGYIAPEYALEAQVSVKSDVYSFGVLVLEIVSGQKISSFQNNEENQEPLLNFAWRNWVKGTPWNLVDPTIVSTSSSFEILRCIHIGLLCVQANPSDRPTVSSIDLMLSSNSVTLEVPSQPAFYTESKCLPNMLSHWSSVISDESSSKSANVSISINDVSITELHPRY